MKKKNTMKYKVLRLEDDILIYIPHRQNMKVLGCILFKNQLKLKYNENKSYTIKDLKENEYKLLNNNLDKYIVEFNKEQKIEKTYNIIFHKK